MSAGHLCTPGHTSPAWPLSAHWVTLHQHGLCTLGHTSPAPPLHTGPHFTSTDFVCTHGHTSPARPLHTCSHFTSPASADKPWKFIRSKRAGLQGLLWHWTNGSLTIIKLPRLLPRFERYYKSLSVHKIFSSFIDTEQVHAVSGVRSKLREFNSRIGHMCIL